MNKYTLITLVTALLVILATPVGAMTILLDFGSSHWAPTGNWNTIPNGLRNSTVSNLIDDTGAVTGVSYSGSSWDGATVNWSAWNNGNMEWLQERTAEDYFWITGSSSSSIKLSGLSDSATYRIELVSSHYLAWVMDVTANGSFADADYNGNTGADYSNNWSILDARTDANWMIWSSIGSTGGELVIDFSKESGSAIAGALMISTVVPEPATIALLGIGLAGLAGSAARRRLGKTKQ